LPFHGPNLQATGKVKEGTKLQFARIDDKSRLGDREVAANRSKVRLILSLRSLSVASRDTLSPSVSGLIVATPAEFIFL